MPNWVFNTINGFTPEMHEKYKGENTDFDFNKLIPMPEELYDMPNGSVKHDANAVANYNKARNASEKAIELFELHPEDKRNINVDSFVYNTDMYRIAKGDFERFYGGVGQKCLCNPDQSLNQLMQDDEGLQKDVAVHRQISGNNSCLTHWSPWGYDRKSIDMQYQVLDRYKNYMCDRYQEQKSLYEERKEENKTSFEQPYYEKYPTLEDLGNRMAELKEQYGADNWYDFSCQNWATKWNACHTEYDEEEETLRFDTAWSVPEPILGKLQEENTDAKFDVYSEEETGWWMEYETRDGKLYNTAEGEYTYEEVEDENGFTDYVQTSDGRKTLENPILITSKPLPPFTSTFF